MRRTHEDIEDELLILRCQDGEREALSALVNRWQPRLRAFAWRLTGERETARDVVQDCWMAIVRGLKRLDDPACFRTWAYRIVRNKCADWTRRRSVQRGADRVLAGSSLASGEGEGTDAHEAEEISALRKAMDELSEDQRAILSLHYLDGLSVRAIGETLGVPEGTVKSRLFHARVQLRGVLERVNR